MLSAAQLNLQGSSGRDDCCVQAAPINPKSKLVQVKFGDLDGGSLRTAVVST